MKWFDMRKKVPRIGDEVIIQDYENHCYMGLVEPDFDEEDEDFVDKTSILIHTDGNSFVHQNNIVAWMPLPPKFDRNKSEEKSKEKAYNIYKATLEEFIDEYISDEDDRLTALYALDNMKTLFDDIKKKVKDDEMNTNHLSGYSKIAEIHMIQFPMLRIGQFFENVRSKYGDLYYVSDEDLAKCYADYAKKENE